MADVDFVPLHLHVEEYTRSDPAPLFIEPVPLFQGESDLLFQLPIQMIDMET